MWQKIVNYTLMFIILAGSLFIMFRGINLSGIGTGFDKTRSNIQSARNEQQQAISQFKQLESDYNSTIDRERDSIKREETGIERTRQLQGEIQSNRGTTQSSAELIREGKSILERIRKTGK